MKNKDKFKQKERAEGKDKFGLLILKALSFFIENPYENIHLREFSRKLRISPNTSQRFLNLFLKQKLVKEERIANLRYFKANLDNLVFRQIKIVFSLKKIEDSGLINLLCEDASHVVLFGSMVEGLDGKKSDVDLLIVSSDKGKVNKVLSDFQKKFDRGVNSHIFSWVEWKEQAKINKAFYHDVIIKGISLVGEKPVVE